MRRIIFIAAVALSGCATHQTYNPCFDAKSESFPSNSCTEIRRIYDQVFRSKPLANSTGVAADGYGLGVGIDSYGSPRTLRPAFPEQKGYYGDSRVVAPNGYGLGVHVDQYGRAVSY